MTEPLPTEALRSAVAALKLRDIVLHESKFSRPSNSDGPQDAVERVKRNIQFTRQPSESDGHKVESLLVLVGLGVRITAPEGDNPTIYLEIEADFLADYEIVSEISDDAIKAFTSFNAVHNVWPFWRQHVFDVVQRARLQHIQIPLFAGISE